MDSGQTDLAPEAARATAVTTSPLFRSLTGLVLAGIALYLLSWAAPVATPFFSPYVSRPSGLPSTSG
ncbi:MAG: hypothetical protein KJ069_02540 [Anaerolineae bacterium]|nr:hypothetical protein [Anaerolineae bacterium]